MSPFFAGDGNTMTDLEGNSDHAPNEGDGDQAPKGEFGEGGSRTAHGSCAHSDEE